MFNKRFPYQLFNQKQNNYKMVREDEVLFVIVVVAIESVNEHGNKRSFFFWPPTEWGKVFAFCAHP